jgi:hypothetical protein
MWRQRHESKGGDSMTVAKVQKADIDSGLVDWQCPVERHLR